MKTHSLRFALRPKPQAPSPQPLFDSAYYRRFYLTPNTRAMSREETDTRGALIGSLVRQLDIRVDRILDVGCGLGWYARPLKKLFPTAHYTGTEFSEYLCNKKGWIHGSVVNLKLKGQFDLVICADVLQYLNNRDAERAIGNLAKWCRGVLYFHVPTKRDWQENVDPSGTDSNVQLRSALWYQRQLRKHFVHAGCGVHVRDNVPFAQWQLEEPWR
ncbi:MAG: class I SAM-dependent methyltransferase [Candidatus Obscuribacterales bacterium]|nr:class I SAM-dependent methyltransferase [Steroidobacteraceae bacterium]